MPKENKEKLKKERKEKVAGKTIQEIADEMGLTSKQTALVREAISNPARTSKDIVLAAGYSDSLANRSPSQVLGSSRVKSAIREFIVSNGYDERMKGTYDEVFASPDLRLRLDAVKELHKIKGDVAPTKHISAHVDWELPE